MELTNKARILNAEDVITKDVYTITEGPDRKGNFLLVNDETNKRARAHPSRILKIVPGASPVYRHGDEMRANCPGCTNSETADSNWVTVEVAQEEVVCAAHGPFVVDWGQVDSGTRPAPPELEKKPGAPKTAKKPRAASGKSAASGKPASKTSTNIDFAALKKVGEVWTKSNVEFDYPGFDVKAHVLLIDDGENSRKYCFNSYNGTWGKKSKDDDLQLFVGNKKGQGNKMVWYYVKGGMEAERRKLEKSGYLRMK